jgi:hypothetical protein
MYGADQGAEYGRACPKPIYALLEGWCATSPMNSSAGNDDTEANWPNAFPKWIPKPSNASVRNFGPNGPRVHQDCCGDAANKGQARRTSQPRWTRLKRPIAVRWRTPFLTRSWASLDVWHDRPHRTPTGFRDNLMSIIIAWIRSIVDDRFPAAALRESLRKPGT